MKERTAHLKFGQAESFWKNTQYHHLISFGHLYEGYKLQYAEIPWKDVPTPQAKMHVKIKSGKSQNQLNKERRKQQTWEEYHQEQQQKDQFLQQLHGGEGYEWHPNLHEENERKFQDFLQKQNA